MTIKLHESHQGGVSTTGKVWRAQLISEGQGSSGHYSAELLERDGALAFPAGTHIYKDHLGIVEHDERSGSHSIDNLVGVTTESAVYEAETGSLHAPIKWFHGYENFIAEAKDYIGLSIEAQGTVSNEGIVESLAPSPFNAVAVVPRAGRDGKVLNEIVESLREHGKINDNAGNAASGTRKDGVMTPEDIQKVAESVAALLKPDFAAIQEALAPAPVVTEETEAAPSAAEVAEAVLAANLPVPAQKRVFEALNTNPDADLASVIEGEKALVDALKESFKAEQDNHDGGFLRESRGTKNDDTSDFTVTGWGN